LFKIYTLNALFECILCDIAALLRHVGAIWGQYDERAEKIRNQLVFILSGATVYITAAISFRLFTLFFVTASYVSYRKPLLFRDHFTTRKWILYCMLIHAFSFTVGAVTTYAVTFPQNQYHLWWGIILAHGSNALVIIVLIAEVIISVNAIMAVRAAQVQDSLNSQRPQSQGYLVAFLTYSVPLFVLTLPVAIPVLCECIEFLMTEAVFYEIGRIAALLEVQVILVILLSSESKMIIDVIPY
uniref:G protein-coupled receptor n=1 Tax=Anisakis simplex TaxID=6269 RepID=A0A0M3KD74_ANISI